jgi:hypothetical protein
VFLGCPPPNRLLVVGFCGVDGILGQVEGLLLWCVEYVFIGRLFVRARGCGDKTCERKRCGGLVWKYIVGWVVSVGARMMWMLKHVCWLGYGRDGLLCASCECALLAFCFCVITSIWGLNSFAGCLVPVHVRCGTVVVKRAVQTLCFGLL